MNHSVDTSESTKKNYRVDVWLLVILVVGVFFFHMNNDNGVYVDTVADAPAFNGSPYVIVNDGVPVFPPEELELESCEYYAPLDALGRAGYAMVCLTPELLPKEVPEDTGDATPTGWVQGSYDFIEGGALYDRCSLIGAKLGGKTGDPRNLITATHYLSVENLRQFEDAIANYIYTSGNRVLYRVTPIYEGDNLLASGLQLEAFSLEDDGEGICFNLYFYNVQQGVTIDYATGENSISQD